MMFFLFKQKKIVCIILNNLESVFHLYKSISVLLYKNLIIKFKRTENAVLLLFNIYLMEGAV